MEKCFRHNVDLDPWGDNRDPDPWVLAFSQVPDLLTHCTSMLEASQKNKAMSILTWAPQGILWDRPFGKDRKGQDRIRGL